MREQWTYFQGTDNVLRVTTCSKELGCPITSHDKVYWAWDRLLGAWVHYAR